MAEYAYGSESVLARASLQMLGECIASDLYTRAVAYRNQRRIRTDRRLLKTNHP